MGLDVGIGTLLRPLLRDRGQLVVPDQLVHIGRRRLGAGAAAALLALGDLATEVVVRLKKLVLLSLRSKKVIDSVRISTRGLMDDEREQ